MCLNCDSVVVTLVINVVTGFTPISTVHSREKYDGGTIGRRSHVNVLATPAAATSLIGVRHYSWTELEITGIWWLNATYFYAHLSYVMLFAVIFMAQALQASDFWHDNCIFMTRFTFVLQVASPTWARHCGTLVIWQSCIFVTTSLSACHPTLPTSQTWFTLTCRPTSCIHCRQNLETLCRLKSCCSATTISDICRTSLAGCFSCRSSVSSVIALQLSDGSTVTRCKFR